MLVLWVLLHLVHARLYRFENGQEYQVSINDLSPSDSCLHAVSFDQIDADELLKFRSIPLVKRLGRRQLAELRQAQDDLIAALKNTDMLGLLAKEDSSPFSNRRK